MGTRRATSVLAVLALILAGCTASAVTPSPSEPPPASATATATPTAAPTSSPRPTLPSGSISWSQLPASAIPAVPKPPQPYLSNSILHGWRTGYVEFVWNPDSFLLTPWTSSDALSWNHQAAIDVAALYRAEFKAFKSTYKPLPVPLDCAFQDMGWAEDGRGLIQRGRLACDLGCGSYWYSSETMLVSADARNWTAIDERKTFGDGGAGGISGGDSGFVALGAEHGRQVGWKSMDGLEWSQYPLPVDFTDNGSTASKPVSVTGAIVQSGVHRTTPSAAAFKFADATWGPFVWSCNGSGGDVAKTVFEPEVFTSTDGSTWLQADLPGAVQAKQVWFDVTRVDDRTLFAIEDYLVRADGIVDSMTWVSRDGRSWVRWTGNYLIRQYFVIQAHSGGLVQWPRDGGGSDLMTLTDDLELTPLRPTGSPPPATADRFTIGPAGVLATDDGSAIWLGVR